MLPALLVWSLPLLFVIHDAEEVLFLPSWLRRNRGLLVRRVPSAMRRVVLAFPDLPRRVFAAMAGEELALLLLVSALASGADLIHPWLALYLAFGVHLLLHVGQCLVVGCWLPVVASSLFCLPFWFWGVAVVRDRILFSLEEWLFCGLAGCVFAAVNLGVMHVVARRMVRFGRRAGTYGPISGRGPGGQGSRAGR